MSANADLARQAIVAAAARDFETMRQIVAEDFEVHASVSLAKGFTASGLDGIRQWFANLDQLYDELRAYPDTARDASAETVWLRGAVVTRAKGEKTTKARLVNWVLDIKDGKITRLRSFDDEAESLEAAGLA